MEGKAAVLGSVDFVLPFTALGLEAFTAETDEQVRENAERILEQGYSLVIVSEEIAHQADEVFDATKAMPVPCVLVLPFVNESDGFAFASLGKVLKLATGIDILN
ncbi:MAG: V-type ATP synthase subunit F [Phycisphaerae bacterium]|jgi:vacuolar-type H+-ATPase subunit F/Vma7